MKNSALDNALKNHASKSPLSAVDYFAPQFTQVGGFDVRYVRHANEAAPTLILLNGFPQSIRMWECFWGTLSQSFDLLAFDIPGFGLSKAEEADMSPRRLSELVIEIMDHFSIEKAHLVGPDVGVPITLATAINHGNRLASINIFDGPGSYPPDMAPILKALIRFRFVRWLAKGLNKKAVMNTNFQVAVKDGYSHFQPNERAIKEYFDITHNGRNHQCAISFFGSYRRDLPWIDKHLDQIQVPTLITWGKLDPFVLASNASYLSSQIAHNKLVIFEKASHFSSEDAGEVYLETLTQWLRGEYNLQQAI